MKDMEEEDVVVNRGAGALSYTPWYEHITQIITGHWKTFLIYSLGCFGITWGLIEASSFFFPYAGLNSIFVLYLVLVLSLIVALTRCVYDYRIFVPPSDLDMSTVETGADGDYKKKQMPRRKH